MRITNKIMRNNSLYNINQNKILEDKLNNQMTNQSKITRPSDDPVVAIRALRLRTNVSTVNQYYEKNAPDADSWISLTGDALKTVGDVLKDLYTQSMDASKKSFTYADLDIVLTQMKSLTKEFYASGNVDYAGRYIFSGYRTATPITFTKEDIKEFTKDPENLKTFIIEEKLGYKDISTISYTDWAEAVDKANNDDNEMTVTNTTLYRFRFSYDNLKFDFEEGETSRVVTEDELQFYFTGAATPTSITAYADAEEAYKAVANGACEVAYIPSTGEIVFGEDYYNDSKNVNENMSLRVKYSKSDWSAGDINPVHYFHTVECSEKTIKDAMALEEADDTLNKSLNSISKAESALQSLKDILRNLPNVNSANKDALEATIKEAQKAAKNLLDAAQAQYNLLDDDAKANPTDEQKAVIDALTAATKLNASFTALNDYDLAANGAAAKTALEAAIRTGITDTAPTVINAATEQNKEYQIEVNRIRNLVVEYNPTGEDQDIYYNVGYNQTIQVNTHASEVFTHGVQREIDDFEIYFKQLKDVETKMSDLENEQKKYAEDTKEYKDIQLQIDAANKALTYVRENVQKKFENQISKYQSYIDDTNIAVTNNGTRGSRLDLITSRLMNQKATFKDLQSNNEDVDMSEVTVQLKSAELTYEASLMATSKIMQTNLMNYI